MYTTQYTCVLFQEKSKFKKIFVETDTLNYNSINKTSIFRLPIFSEKIQYIVRMDGK